MYILTIYQNGIRYYSSPVNELPEDISETTIQGESIRVDCKSYTDGYRFDCLFESVTAEQFEAYKKAPADFTAKRVF